MLANILLGIGGWVLGFLIVGGIAFDLNKEKNDGWNKLLCITIIISWTLIWIGWILKW